MFRPNTTHFNHRLNETLRNISGTLATWRAHSTCRTLSNDSQLQPNYCLKVRYFITSGITLESWTPFHVMDSLPRLSLGHLHNATRDTIATLHWLHFRWCERLGDRDVVGLLSKPPAVPTTPWWIWSQPSTKHPYVTVNMVNYMSNCWFLDVQFCLIFPPPVSAIVASIIFSTAGSKKKQTNKPVLP